MTKFFVPFLLIFISLSATAQTERTLKFSVGAELGFASGSFSNTHSIGTGVTAQAEYQLAEKLRATATTGFLVYAGKSQGTNLKNTAQTIIPIRGGIKYFLAGGAYVGAQSGLAILGSYDKNVSFAYSPLLGYEFMTKSGKSLDATLKYDAYSGSNGTIGAIGVRLAYVF
ncbi:MAG: hypothetical protein V4725_14935 [Bacteroidota bacterium]